MNLCIYCLKPTSTEDLTVEHTFAESWYPESFAGEKWKSPSCRNCNARFGNLEREILEKAALCFDPTSPLTADLTARALRAVDASAGRNTNDALIRSRKLEKLLKETFSAATVGKKAFPGFGPQDGYPLEEQMGMPVPRGLHEIGAKLARGIEYRLTGLMHGPMFEVKARFCDPEAVRDVINKIRKGSHFLVAPGIEFYRISAQDYNPSSKVAILHEIRIWERLTFFTSIIAREALLKPGESGNDK